MLINAYELAVMAEDCYNLIGGSVAAQFWNDAGWVREAGVAKDANSGFAAVRYWKNGVAVIAYRGTSDPTDAVADANMTPLLREGVANHALEKLLQAYGVGDRRTSVRIATEFSAGVLESSLTQKAVGKWGNRVPAGQTREALSFYDATFPKPVMVVGHSLGGALAKTVGDNRKVVSVGFNSPYMGGMQGVFQHSSMLETSIDTVGDPLSLLTREVGNLPHGRVINVEIHPLSRLPPQPPNVPAPRQNCEIRDFGALGLSGYLGCKAGVWVRHKATQAGAELDYLSELGDFLQEAALHYHSMANLRRALKGTTIAAEST